MTNTRKKPKEVKAWALRFRDDGDLWPVGHIPTLFDTRKEAMAAAHEFSFQENDEAHADPVRVRVSIKVVP